MPSIVNGVIARSKDAPVELTTIVVPDPGPGEAVVKIQACGVCHTDHNYVAGGVGDNFPYLLGHEAAGIVEAIGEDVNDLQVGDFVILNWRAICGDQCRACKRGEPWYCFNTANATQKMTLEDGTELEPALGIGAFAEKTLVAAGQCTKVNPAVTPAAAGLVGCGIMAGAGAAMNTAKIKRGESVAVYGCGGVGDAAIMGALIAGATTVIAVDIDDRKLDKAKEFGATHTINSKKIDPIQAIKDATDGFGADVVIEATGRADTWEQALASRDLAGRLIMVGVPQPGQKTTVPLDQLYGAGGSISPAWYGDCLPSRDFPMLIDLHLQKRIDLDTFVSEKISLDSVNEAFDKMAAGDVLRSVVIL
ncbi:S-(hydroxymethyl)mycothiol dehydrogenase [Dermatophilus congolensis]|uniref:S-(Hydroxymethyl)mycothiol dehydrogenase n=1 Tax=Dermatophilus congolensis TaxID=1863 RepID=A0AA46GZN3_9MICO|nr:S-(hydroxymethyl)mycothiol dehydrogenase [Dermatophilus congolensis]MBO3142069.1 S-(hydroxymethyl)mycothiol dehydrogenase [Dermatophilus congolensis]MBO3151061.1 S-(hydroxymethyl)mycothiol dehydrogenase [Dermatophilus congolensis]MBO3161934.1 S-(hydroxymethyl)mycothiol dehydrogenase [Dermatophilus congolensis]MBO3162348.1 S-(hydroxymethyl)mycothiol dehydrogenase [Dermatophilus congolensis]MBO3175902.1 S-(hydroxymethyl)mycothiol dehydrogenase [Dermatophilus congolensis]